MGHKDAPSLGSMWSQRERDPRVFQCGSCIFSSPLTLCIERSICSFLGPSLTSVSAKLRFANRNHSCHGNGLVFNDRSLILQVVPSITKKLPSGDKRPGNLKPNRMAAKREEKMPSGNHNNKNVQPGAKLGQKRSPWGGTKFLPEGHKTPSKLPRINSHLLTMPTASSILVENRISPSCLLFSYRTMKDSFIIKIKPRGFCGSTLYSLLNVS